MYMFNQKRAINARDKRARAKDRLWVRKPEEAEKSVVPT
jgi:hypothetical protein